MTSLVAVPSRLWPFRLGAWMHYHWPARLRSSVAESPPLVHVAEIDSCGRLERRHKTLEDFRRLKASTGLPIRDMRFFFQTKVVQQQGSLPAILARPASQCFLLNVDAIRVLCLPDRCVLLHPDDPVVADFAAAIVDQLEGAPDKGSARKRGNGRGGRSIRAEGGSSMHVFLDALSETARASGEGAKFECVVMEAALSTVASKYRRNLNLVMPIMELLLRETSSNPSAAMLRRMLAFRKSLGAFESKVVTVRGAVTDVLREPDDLAGLSLSAAGENGTGEMELLLEAYDSDLKEIAVELAAMREQIEDTNDFIKMHLNSIRNRTLKMALFMEMGTLSVGAGALCSGVFGMNLANGWETHPQAFFVTTGGIFLLVGGLFGVFARRFLLLNRDYSGAKSYQALKRFLFYVEGVESAVREGPLDRAEFKRILEPVIGAQLTEEEVEAVFSALDADRDGALDVRELTAATAASVGQ